MKLNPTIANIGAAVARFITRAVSSAIVWLLLLSSAGSASLVVGVFVLAGFGFACLAGGALLIVGAAIIHRGMSNG